MMLVPVMMRRMVRMMKILMVLVMIIGSAAVDAGMKLSSEQCFLLQSHDSIFGKKYFFGEELDEKFIIVI